MRKRHILLSVLLRACLKITFRQMCVILWQNPNAGGVAGCVEQIRAGYTAKVGTRFTAADGGNEFQARSRTVTKGWGCKMRFIGITGGIGAGKSEILHYIGQHCRCEIYLADEVAHLVKQPGSRAYRELVQLLGQDVTAADGQIDRAAMADKIFAKPELLEQVQEICVKVCYVTLHVGLGTFRPVKAEEITDHEMHSEFCQISQETADLINQTKANGGRIICVGTTSCRTVESFAAEDGTMSERSGWTNIFIYPGYKFKVLDALITNFHLPQSTLIMLVSALAGRESILAAYETAVRERYRFFSFGDAMFIGSRIDEPESKKPEALE